MEGEPGTESHHEEGCWEPPRLLSTTLPHKCLQMAIVLLILSSSDLSASMLPALREDVNPHGDARLTLTASGPRPCCVPAAHSVPTAKQGSSRSPTFPSCGVGVKVIPARRLEDRTESGARTPQAGPGVRNSSRPYSPLPVPITNQKQTKPALRVQSRLQADGRAKAVSPGPPQPGRTPTSARASWVGSQESPCISPSHSRTQERVSSFLGRRQGVGGVSAWL